MLPLDILPLIVLDVCWVLHIWENKVEVSLSSFFPLKVLVAFLVNYFMQKQQWKFIVLNVVQTTLNIAIYCSYLVDLLSRLTCLQIGLGTYVFWDTLSVCFNRSHVHSNSSTALSIFAQEGNETQRQTVINFWWNWCPQSKNCLTSPFPLAVGHWSPQVCGKMSVTAHADVWLLPSPSHCHLWCLVLRSRALILTLNLALSLRAAALQQRSWLTLRMSVGKPCGLPQLCCAAGMHTPICV